MIIFMSVICCCCCCCIYCCIYCCCCCNSRDFAWDFITVFITIKFIFFLFPKLGFLLNTISYGMNLIVDDLDVFKLNAILGNSFAHSLVLYCCIAAPIMFSMVPFACSIRPCDCGCLLFIAFYLCEWLIFVD